jgi:hypothetical protein
VDLSIHLRDPSCWTQVLDAFQGLRRCNSFVQAVRQGTSISPCACSESVVLRGDETTYKAYKNVPTLHFTMCTIQGFRT